MAAGDVFQAMGQTDLAWDYLTTPLAMKPNEAAPWRDLAHAQRDAGNVKLASRAFAAAFTVEPTNAEILWEHAQMLGVLGSGERAAQLYRRIAKGKSMRLNRAGTGRPRATADSMRFSGIDVSPAWVFRTIGSRL